MSPKIQPLRRISRLISRLKKEGKKVVFTNGCFDLLHLGHIRYLRRAKKLGDYLIVGLNSDASVRRLKGKGRPLLPARDRAEILSELSSVDCVTIFREVTPSKLIRLVKPDVLVKGSDWKRNEIVGKDWVESYGGKVWRVPFVKGRSSSRIIERVQKLRSG